MPVVHRHTAIYILLTALAATTPAAEPAPVAFNRDILPILSNNCFACHGPDAPARKADLRLDLEASARQPLADGGTPIIPGDPAGSLVMQRIRATDPETRMPPPDSGKSLSTAEQTLLERWITGGAEWQPHWAFIPPQTPPIPETADMAWARNPIDHFVRARLEDAGLAPSQEADRYTLLRRVTLALTGLPPSPEEIQRFVEDPNPAAYDATVERLLASPRYGEHMARYWLDLARYADTNGYAADIERTMWRYRDWVIAAFNNNMPFDQFTIEQLAGDLLPEPTLDQQIATGFNRNHPIMMEGGAIFEEYRVMNVIDRVDTTATAWLGLTMKCAQCHDHKYDPISQREFFEFYAFFNNVAEEESRLFGTELDGNSLPRIKAPLPEQEAEQARLDQALAEVRAEKSQPDAALDAAQVAWEAEARAAAAARWTALDATPNCGESENRIGLTAISNLQTITALRVEIVPAPDGDAPSATLAELSLLAVPRDGSTEATAVVITESMALDADARPAHDGDAKTAWQPSAASPFAVFAFGTPIVATEGTEGTALLLGLQGEGLDPGRLRFSVSGDPAYLPATLGPWRVSGPHTAETGAEALAAMRVDPDNIEATKWSAPPDGLTDGKTISLAGKTCATWFHRVITAPAPRSMDLALDNRNAVRVWVNGRLVLDKEAQRGEVGPHPTPLQIELRAGDNNVLIQVADYYDFNAHTFYFAQKGETFGPWPLAVAVALDRPVPDRTEADNAALRTAYRSRHWDGWDPLHQRELDLAWERAQLEKRIPTTMVMAERADPRATHILLRGLYDQPGDLVEPGIPAALGTAANGEPNDRLALAQWIVSPDNPLAARVAVNRLWQQAFGTGLVATPDDFGIQGGRPSHPDLLDWLARCFIDSGWDIQAVQRLIVTSSAFRQASHLRPELAERDPHNRLLARGPYFRLGAEAIRDSALAASGLLEARIGGPSVKPYQPPGLWKDVAYGGGGQRYTAQEFIQDSGEDLYRRSVYTFWKRAAAPPGMLLFDAPNRDVCTAQRGRSNTPLQALSLMNDVQYVEAARVLAARAMKESGSSPSERMDYIGLLVLGRHPGTAESAALLNQYEAQVADYRTMPEAAVELLRVGESEYDPTLDAAELAAWTLVANALMNTDAAVSQH